MRTFAVSLVMGFNYFILFYYGFVNLIYTALLLVSVVVTLRHIRRIRYSPFKDFVSSPETPPVSILVPAYNEERIIVRTVRSTLSVNYPFFEVIVVNDGSTDATLDTLIRTFNLRKVDRAYRNVLKTMPVRGFYYNPDVPKLLVVDKGNSGKADSLNCGINISRSPYFCTVDADSVLEENALIKLMTPTVESTVPVVACGGVIRALNGIHLEDGAVRHIDLPRSTLAMFQIVEYLRAFLFGRVGLNAMNGILILSGAFSLFRKASVVEAGGYRVENVTEDMELIIRLHRRAIDRKTPYSVKFISDPVCWTEVPEDLKMLGRQRRRWHLGLMQSMIQNRSALFNPPVREVRMGCPSVLPVHRAVEPRGGTDRLRRRGAVLPVRDAELRVHVPVPCHGGPLRHIPVHREHLPGRDHLSPVSPVGPSVPPPVLRRDRELRVPADQLVLEVPGVSQVPGRDAEVGVCREGEKRAEG